MSIGIGSFPLCSGNCSVCAGGNGHCIVTRDDGDCFSPASRDEIIIRLLTNSWAYYRQYMLDYLGIKDTISLREVVAEEKIYSRYEEEIRKRMKAYEDEIEWRNRPESEDDTYLYINGKLLAVKRARGNKNAENKQ